ncbi:MAG: hypothetical protein U0414_31175 [Polyangiaceae bacterium]
MRGAAALTLSLIALAGCAKIPPPRIVADADAVSTSKAAVDAKESAPQAYAAAQKLLSEAHDALEHGLPAHAQILAEQAIAAFEGAEALARLARAERRSAEADGKNEKTQKELDALSADVDRARVELDALERDLRVLKDEAIARSSGPPTPEQLAARRQTSQSFLMQAKFMCAAARILAATPPQGQSGPASFDAELGAADAGVTKLEGELAKEGAGPLDLATEARGACLDVLTKVRRANGAASTSSGKNSGNADADALLGDLSAYASRVGGDLKPERDERGVLVSLRAVFEGDHVGADARARFTELDRVAAQHPRFALAIVVHTDAAVPKTDEAKWRARADEIATFFGSVPQARLMELVAGNASPVVDPHGKDKARNARVEIVFIAAEP